METRLHFVFNIEGMQEIAKEGTKKESKHREKIDRELTEREKERHKEGKKVVRQNQKNSTDQETKPVPSERRML
jgi:hypothetical protein